MQESGVGQREGDEQEPSGMTYVYKYHNETTVNSNKKKIDLALGC